MWGLRIRFIKSRLNLFRAKINYKDAIELLRYLFEEFSLLWIKNSYFKNKD